MFMCMRAKSLQSCPTLCDPMDCSPPGSSVPGILQTRILEKHGAIAMELASSPGMSGDHIISARGLPGKYAPEESGKLIAETFIRLSLGKEVES